MWVYALQSYAKLQTIVAEAHPRGRAKVRDLALVIPMPSGSETPGRTQGRAPDMHGPTAIQTQREDGHVLRKAQGEVRRIEHSFLLTWVDSQG